MYICILFYRNKTYLRTETNWSRWKISPINDARIYRYFMLYMYIYYVTYSFKAAVKYYIVNKYL